MPFSPKVKLIKCGNCGRMYNNPFTHVCKVKFGKPVKAKPKGKR